MKFLTAQECVRWVESNLKTDLDATYAQQRTAPLPADVGQRTALPRAIRETVAGAWGLLWITA